MNSTLCPTDSENVGSSVAHVRSSSYWKCRSAVQTVSVWSFITNSFIRCRKPSSVIPFVEASRHVAPPCCCRRPFRFAISAGVMRVLKQVNWKSFSSASLSESVRLRLNTRKMRRRMHFTGSLRV